MKEKIILYIISKFIHLNFVESWDVISSKESRVRLRVIGRIYFVRLILGPSETGPSYYTLSIIRCDIGLNEVVSINNIPIGNEIVINTITAYSNSDAYINADKMLNKYFTQQLFYFLKI